MIISAPPSSLDFNVLIRRPLVLGLAITVISVLIFSVGLGVGTTVPDRSLVVTKIVTVPVEIERVITKEVPVTIERVVTVPIEVEKNVTRVVTVIVNRVVTPTPTTEPLLWIIERTEDTLTGTKQKSLSQTQRQDNGKYYRLTVLCERTTADIAVLAGGIEFIDEEITPRRASQTSEKAYYPVKYRFDAMSLIEDDWPRVVAGMDGFVWLLGEDARNFFYRVVAADSLILRVESWPEQVSYTAKFDLSRVPKQALIDFLGECE